MKEFRDTLIYKSYCTKCTQYPCITHFIFERSNRKEVIMFLKDFENMIASMINGKITGDFTFRKRGANYGCIYLSPYFRDDGKQSTDTT